jgi:hypothetical protein
MIQLKKDTKAKFVNDFDQATILEWSVWVLEAINFVKGGCVLVFRNCKQQADKHAHTQKPNSGMNIQEGLVHECLFSAILRPRCKK